MSSPETPRGRSSDKRKRTSGERAYQGGAFGGLGPGHAWTQQPTSGSEQRGNVRQGGGAWRFLISLLAGAVPGNVRAKAAALGGS
jgi:hypothetical protein